MNSDCSVARIVWSESGNNLAVCLSNYYVYVFKENAEGEWSTQSVINPEGNFESERNTTDN